MSIREAAFTRRIDSRGDKVYSKMLSHPVDYEDIVDNTNMMKNNSHLILVRKPFLLDNELRGKVTEGVDSICRSLNTYYFSAKVVA